MVSKLEAHFCSSVVGYRSLIRSYPMGVGGLGSIGSDCCDGNGGGVCRINQLGSKRLDPALDIVT